MIQINERKMLGALTALRFFAAAMIVLGHAHPLFASFGNIVVVPYNQGVSFFFVLSGFILAYNYTEFRTREQFHKFYIARFARIWPLHLVTCILWIGLIFNFDRQDFFGGKLGSVKLLANLLLVQSWVPLKEWALSFNGVAWSISAEFFFYLCFPFVVILWRRQWAILLGLSGIIVIVGVAAANALKLPAEDSYLGVGLLGLIYFGPLIRMFEFLIGIGLANLIRGIGPLGLGRDQWLLVEMAAILAIVTALLGVASPAGIQNGFGIAGAYYFQHEGLWLFWAFLIGVFAVSAGPIARFLSTRPLVFLGEISFALYLVHSVVIAYLEGYADRVKAAGLDGYVGFWVACLVLAALLFFGIERPCRNLVLGWWQRRRHGVSAWSRSSVRPIEFAAQGILVVAILSAAFLRPTTIFAIDTASAKAFLAHASILKNSSGQFENGIRILGVQVREDPAGGTVAKVLLMSERAMHLNSIMAVHLNDASGAIIGHPGDFVLDTAAARVEAGTYWIHSFSVNTVELHKAATFGVAMYRTMPDLSTVSSGRTDWAGHRLLIPTKN
jgi:peptidoglycan/LPS O-acetylase OafA/YrhL